MTLLAADAAAAAKEAGAVDFAQMDCAACHHDLKQPSCARRAVRGSARPAGVARLAAGAVADHVPARRRRPEG